jgi:beta-N-acetylhexosaminidase
MRVAATLLRTGLCVVIMICGLALRRFGHDAGLPSLLVKYGGSVLWGAMVFFWVAIAVSRWPRWQIVCAAMIVAVGVELFRLVHTPWLDSFRLTLAGALLLGRIFSLWDICAYGVGIALAVAFDYSIIALKTNGDRDISHSAS